MKSTCYLRIADVSAPPDDRGRLPRREPVRDGGSINGDDRGRSTARKIAKFLSRARTRRRRAALIAGECEESARCEGKKKEKSLNYSDLAGKS